MGLGIIIISGCYFFRELKRKKGLDILFEALSDLDFNWILTIAGTGKPEYINQLKNKAIEYQIDKHLNWIGFANESDKEKLFNGNDILVLFSENENFANVIIESLSHGLPVAISTQVGLSDFVGKNNLGWIAELNCTSIRTAITRAKNDTTKRSNIKSHARSIVNTSFHIKEILPKYISLYSTL